MNIDATKKVIALFQRFGILFQLPAPDPEYVMAIQEFLSSKHWKLSDLEKAFTQLVADEIYVETAKFGKYPTINDFLRVRQQTESQPFYRALSAYLAGDWWEKDTINQIATPEQRNAILLAGGLENLHARATGEKPTAIHKLLEIVAQNVAESPTELIDTSHRIGAPSTMEQIVDFTNKGVL